MVSQLSAIEVADLLRKENSISERGISPIVPVNHIEGQAHSAPATKASLISAIGLAIVIRLGLYFEALNLSLLQKTQ